MRTISLSTSLIVLCVLLPGPAIRSQAPVSVAAKYAAESFVIDRSDWVYSENADGTGYREHTVAVTIQSEAALRTFGVVTVGFASASEHVELHYARARHKDGTVTETATTGALEQPEQVTRDAPFYSDLKEEQLPIKNLQVGDTLEWQARIVRTRAEAAGEFWDSHTFADESVVSLEESLELRVPTASGATVWTNPKLGVKPVETKDGVTTIYRWETSQPKPTTGPEAEAAKKARKAKLLTPDEELDAEQGKLPSVAWTTFKSWEAVGAWYRELEGERAVPDDEVKAKVAELIAGKSTEEEKVRAVYAYVSAQIRYIGVAFGVGRYQPHEAVDVLHNQYGDCKDKATLLTAMLAVLGLHSDSVLIGAGIRWNEVVPSPGAFNHLINRVSVGGKEVWLDATQEVAPYEVLLLELRDKPALVVPDKGVATVEHTPKELPFPSVETWKPTATLDEDGTEESHIESTMRGDDEMVMRMVVHSVAPAQYDELIQQMMEGMGYRGKTSHADLSRPEDTTEPFHFAFDYHRESTGDWPTLRIVAQLSPLQLPFVDEKDPPVASIQLGVPRTSIDTSEIKLPAGWSAVLPEAVHEKTAFANYDLTYLLDKATGTIYAERKVVVLQAKIPASEWRTYKKFADAVGVGMETFIQLTSSAGTSTGAVNQHYSTPEVVDLFKLVTDAFRNKDAKTMEENLKKIKKIDPKNRRLMAWEASLALLRNKPDDAIADDEKELAMYPDEIDRYDAIIWIYEHRKHDRAAAEATFRRWAQAAPQDDTPLLRLAVMLLSDNQPDAALTAATEALSRTKPDTLENEKARRALGDAQIKTGKTEEGHKTLVALLQTSTDAGVLNDAAYDLADAKLELPLAETSARKALAILNEETSNWTMDEQASTLQARTYLLAATWDTMGWILYREGKFGEALPWMQAARLCQGNDTENGHMDAERLALAAAGGKVVDEDGSKTIAEARTQSLGPSGGQVGSAEYRMLFSHGRVERSELDGKGQLTGVEEMLKQVNFVRLFPDGSNAKLVLYGKVTCDKSHCELKLGH